MTFSFLHHLSLWDEIVCPFGVGKYPFPNHLLVAGFFFSLLDPWVPQRNINIDGYWESRKQKEHGKVLPGWKIGGLESLLGNLFPCFLPFLYQQQPIVVVVIGRRWGPVSSMRTKKQSHEKFVLQLCF